MQCNSQIEQIEHCASGDRKKGTGPVPERVKIDQDWEEAMADAMKRKRPKGGWTKPEKGKKKD